MLFSVLVYGSPFNSSCAQTAFRFTQAALEAGHTIHRVFFYGDSVFSSSQLNAPQRDEWNTYQAWADLADQYQLDLVVCIAAALKRGVLDEKEAKRHEKAHFNVAPPFQLSGLGQLTDAMISSDRIISFGE